MHPQSDSKRAQAPPSSPAPKKTRVGKKARAVLDRPPPPQGWRTTDEDEIALRRWRGRTEIVAIEALEPEQPIFGTFRVQSGSGGFYEVEIRGLDGFANSCGCIDHRVNGLGTCKHIEGVLAALRQRGAKAFREAAAAGQSARRGLSRSPRRRRAGLDVARGRRPPHARGARLARAVPRSRRHARCRSRTRSQALVSAWHVAPADDPPPRSGVAPFRAVARAAAPRALARGGARGVPRRGRGRQRRASTCCAIRCCPISAKACCISRSASARCSPTRWASARPCRRSRPASCWPAARASRACWWSARPRSRPSGRSRSRASPTARRARCSAPRPQRLAAYREPRVLHHRQLRAGARRRRRHQRAAAARRRRARRGAAHQELADQDRAAGEVAALALCLRADRHAGREPHRRALFDRAVPRPGAARAAVPLQPRLLRSSTSAAGRSTTRTSPSCAAALAAGDAAPPQGRRRDRAARPHGEDLFRADGRGAAGCATRTTARRPPASSRRRSAGRCRRRSSTACRCCSPACA